MKDLIQYPFEIRPLSEEEGGGFLISFLDFSECISDGETVEEAIQNGLDALQETIAALESMNLAVPEPGSGGSYSGKFIQHVPKVSMPVWHYAPNKKG
jgi:antitoxin HicB